jgi:hypothetical protein
MEDTSFIYIGNDLIELGFNKSTGVGLDKIIDKTTGLDLRSNKVPPAMMFMFLYWTGTVTDIIIQWDAQGFDFSNETGTDYSRINFNYTNLKTYNINATVTVTLWDNSSMADFRLNITNDEDFVLKSIFFPLVWGLGQIGSRADDDEVFYPIGDGIVIKDPLNYSNEIHMTELYPSSVSMQVICHYDPEEAGLYFATHDTQGYPKKPSLDWMEWSFQKHLTGFYQHMVPEYLGNDFFMDYNTVLGTFHGDWYDAADIYSEWAHTTPFVSGGKVFEDKDTPLWLQNTSIVSSANRDADFIHTPLSDIVNITGEFNNLTEANTTHLIFAWAQNGGWVGPYYFPPAAGHGNFTNATSEIKEGGGHTFLYISGSVWRITREEIGYADYELFNSTGLPWVCLNETGEPTFDLGYESIGWHSARMCPMTDFWHDMVVNNTLNCLELGVDIIQIDEFPIGAIYPCYNVSHGHAAGYSNDISEAYLYMIQDARTQGRIINPDFALSMEEPSEFYIRYMDLYVSRDNAPEFLLYPFALEQFGDNIQFVPFFQYVYHEYIMTFGEPIPMNYNYPAPFLDQMKRSLARGFVTGELISGSADVDSNLRPEVKELYNRTVTAIATYASDYLLKGQMLRPPSIDVPKKEILWYFYSQNRTGRPFNETTVLHSAWESDSGDIGYVFVNWDDTIADFDLNLSVPHTKGVNYTIYITRNGQKSILLGWTLLPTDVHITMDPLDVVLIEIIRNPTGNYTFLFPCWNLMSIPMIQTDTELTSVLSSISGYYDEVLIYSGLSANRTWRKNLTSKPSTMNDLSHLDHTRGIWVFINTPFGILFEYRGTRPTVSQEIRLYEGWNLVGYPSPTGHNQSAGLNNLTFGQHVDAIWTYDASTNSWHEMGAGDVFVPGRGYWVHAVSGCTWLVPV